MSEFEHRVTDRARRAEARRAVLVGLRARGDLDRIVAEWRKAVAEDPEYAEAHFTLATVLLENGEFREGWEEFEWRWKLKGFSNPLRRPWDGSAIEGRTIVLAAEHGLGDTIQFARYATEVSRLGGRVIVACQQSLMALLRSVKGVSEVVDYQKTEPGSHVECALLSLPRILGTTVETIPAEVPYVSVPAELVEEWRERMQAIRGFRVGLVWQGNPEHRRDAVRSIALSRLEPLSRIAGVTLVSLQKGFGSEQVQQLGGRFPVVELGEQWSRGDIMDAAAVMKNLDLVISIDSMPCHLAGALGVPVWTLLAFLPDWRWMAKREDSPWYPTMRLFRQPVPGDWNTVMGKLCAALAARVVDARCGATPVNGSAD